MGQFRCNQKVLSWLKLVIVSTVYVLCCTKVIYNTIAYQVLCHQPTPVFEIS